MEYSVKLKGNGLNAIANLLSEYPQRIIKETATVQNKVAKAHSKDIARAISGSKASKANLSDPLNLPIKAVQKSIPVIKRATPTSLSAIIRVKHGFRPSLKAFKARQTKTGVSYKVSRSKGTKKIPGAFIGSAALLGKHVYKRVSKKRLPIRKLLGASVWGVYTKNRMIGWSEEQILEEYGKQAARRQRAIVVQLIRKKGRAEGLTKDQINERIEQI